MKILNGFEAHLIVKGLELVANDMKKDIVDVEKQGKNHIMTTEFVDMTIKELVNKIEHLTIKEL